MTKFQPEFGLDLSQNGPLPADFFRDLVHEIDAACRTGCQSLDERRNRSSDMDLDLAVNRPTEEVKLPTQPDQVDTIHQSSPDCGESRFSEILFQDRRNALACWTGREPLLEFARAPVRPNGNRGVADQEAGTVVGRPSRARSCSMAATSV